MGEVGGTVYQAGQREDAEQEENQHDEPGEHQAHPVPGRVLVGVGVDRIASGVRPGPRPDVRGAHPQPQSVDGRRRQADEDQPGDEQDDAPENDAARTRGRIRARGREHDENQEQHDEGGNTAARCPGPSSAAMQQPVDPGFPRPGGFSRVAVSACADVHTGRVTTEKAGI